MEKSDWLRPEAPQEIVPESTLKRDLTAFQDFKRRWADGTLTEDHPVVVETTRWARTLSYRYGHPERCDDFNQEALFRLSRSDYRGDAPLATYILSVIQRLNIAEWRQGGGGMREELPAEAVDKESLDLVERVMQRLEQDELMANLLATRSELRRTVVNIILGAEKKVGRRRLADIASQTLGHKVTRHEVETVLKQLREVLRRHSGYYKATAG